MKPQKPELTSREYTGVEQAFTFFNERLFAGTLSDLLITYQRKSGTCGYYCAIRSKSAGEFGRNRPPNSVETGRVIRLKSATFSAFPD